MPPQQPSKPSKAKQPVKKCSQECHPSEEQVILYVEVKSYFRLRKEDGTLLPTSGSPHSRIGGTLHAGVLHADVSIVGKGISDKTSEDNKGKKYARAELIITGLPDGIYTIRVEPPEASAADGIMYSRRSTGPAGASTVGKGNDTFVEVNDLEARMYRPVSFFVEIKCLKAAKAWVPWKQSDVLKTFKLDDPKPSDCDPWEWNYANAWTKSNCSDTVYVDLKPDWLSGRTWKYRKRGKNPDGTLNLDEVILHNTGGVSNGDESPKISISAALSVGLNNPEGFCAHYTMDLDGHVVKMYHEKDWVVSHADLNWRGKSANERSVAIETCRPLEGFQDRDQNGDTKDLDHFQKAQFDSMVRWVGDMQSAYPIPTHRVSGHYDTAIKHVFCPGCDYWFDRLEDAGLGMIFPKDLARDEVPADYSVNDPDYDEWFDDNEFVTEKATKLVPKIIQNLKDIGYTVPGKTLSSASVAIIRFQRHFYTGRRYKFRFEATRRKPKYPKGKTRVKVDVLPSTKVNRRLALGIMAVANFVRQSDRQWDQMQQLRKSQQRLEQLDLKLKL